MSVQTGASHTTAESPHPLSQQHRWVRSLPALIIVVITLMGLSFVFDAIFDSFQEAKQAGYQFEIAQVRRVQVAILDADNGLQDYVISGHVDDLEPYLAGVKVLTDEMPALLPRLDKHVSAQADPNASPRPVSRDFADLRAGWDSVLGLEAANQRAEADAALAGLHVKELTGSLQDNIDGYLNHLISAASRLNDRSYTEQLLLDTINIGFSISAIIAMLYAFRRIIRAITSGFDAKHQVEQLFFMTDMLQSAAGREDTDEVLRAAAASLLPGFSGALYVFNNSRDRLDLSTRWGDLAESTVDHISPTSCWALKRGKPHLNQVAEGALRCTHATNGQTILEIPMAARGQLYGLLAIAVGGPEAATRLDQIRPIATAMSDAMSLALSSIDLRERLRTLALRDSLTGLYNRRLLEEMQERMCMDAERRKAPISAIMIDVDHFKKLNDQHGHAAGDAALRDVAAAILSCLRAVDVACRYGGEEFAVLLPDCSVEMAAAKAEQIRGRISERTTAGGMPITVSLGVASIPETSGGLPELLPAADAALYEAKQQGRDRVVVAALRPLAQKLNLIDAGPTARPAE
jgi:diguanylate cyclase (GGDEF)-like protein